MTDTPVVDIRGVGKAFPNVRALSDLTFDVRRGEVMAFVGENGAGKSTLLKILSGDYQLDEGKVLLDGEETSHVNPLEARQKFAGAVVSLRGRTSSSWFCAGSLAPFFGLRLVE